MPTWRRDGYSQLAFRCVKVTDTEWHATADDSQIKMSITAASEWAFAVQKQVERVRAVSGVLDPGLRTDMFLLAVSLHHVRKSVVDIVGLLEKTQAKAKGKDALARFDKAVPDIKNLRDMMEHAGEYRAGLGDLQQPDVRRNKRTRDEKEAKAFALTYFKCTGDEVTLHLADKTLTPIIHAAI